MYVFVCCCFFWVFLGCYKYVLVVFACFELFLCKGFAFVLLLFFVFIYTVPFSIFRIWIPCATSCLSSTAVTAVTCGDFPSSSSLAPSTSICLL